MEAMGKTHGFKPYYSEINEKRSRPERHLKRRDKAFQAFLPRQAKSISNYFTIK